jgi:hypothetical protein
MRFWASASVALVCLLAMGPESAVLARHPVRPRRANELTLAGLRPGRDTVARAVRLYEQPLADGDNSGDWSWQGVCTKELLMMNVDSAKKIQTIHVSDARWIPGDCDRTPPSRWKTGRGLRIGDPASKVVELYGEPNSKSPSTKGKQPLELLYYAFDWAGPDVPQVMEVSCTPEEDGRPGRVVDIMLAAPSL